MDDNNLSHQSMNNDEYSSNHDEGERHPSDDPQSLTPREQRMFSGISMETGGHPLHRKMNEKHIDKVLDIASKHDERQYNLIKQAQENEQKRHSTTPFYMFVSFIFVILFVALILYLFQDQSDILIPAITGIGGLFSGAIFPALSPVMVMEKAVNNAVLSRTQYFSSI